MSGIRALVSVFSLSTITATLNQIPRTIALRVFFLSLSFFLFLTFSLLPNRSCFKRESRSCGSDRAKVFVTVPRYDRYTGRVIEFVGEVGRAKYRLVKNRTTLTANLGSHRFSLFSLSFAVKLRSPRSARSVSNSFATRVFLVVDKFNGHCNPLFVTFPNCSPIYGFY